MPSHSVKQAKTMSAIAHGWRPSGLDIPVKVAKEFHAADAGHKYGKGMDKKSKALRATKHYRKARGGSVEGDGKDDTSYGGTLPRSIQPMTTQIPESWTRLPVNPPPKYAEGGALDDADQAAMMPETYANPLVREKLGQAFSLPQRLVESAGEATPGLRREDYTDNPYAPQPNQELYNTAGETAMQAMGNSGVRPTAGTAGVFVGPYGAHMLRAEQRAAGLPPTVHPVVAQDIAERANNIHPALRDIYKGGAQDLRDAQARSTLEMRQASGNPADQDVWNASGWSRGAEGMPRKEIPDIGAKLVPLPGTDNFLLQHPAGDLHKIYDIPPISFNKDIPVGDGRMYPETNKIELGGHPTQANLKASVGPVLHEIQHAIQNKEGFSQGSNPMLETGSHEFYKSLGHAEPSAESIHRAQLGIQLGIPTTERAVAFDNYRRRSGEQEAENVMNRRAKSFRYLTKPEYTEGVGRGVQLPQDVRESLIPEARASLGIKRASGGRINNFNPERAAAFGLARQGMIQSSVPGRTDKINMNVPSGSYIIPADIPGAIGQGNSVAGGSILDKMFTKGPYGMNLNKSSGPRMGARQSSLAKMGTMHMKMHFAKGGNVGKVTPIVAAGGEYVLHPDTVAQLGHGDITLGHKILDAFVKHVRSKHITTLKGLKPPKGSK
jgi:hypothetical protein